MLRRRQWRSNPAAEARYLQLRDSVGDKRLGAAVSWSLAATLAITGLVAYGLESH